MDTARSYVGIMVIVLLALGGWLWFAPAQPPQAVESQVVELADGDTYDLTASVVEKEIDGTEYRMLAYNGSIPGPLLKIPQGAEVTINFKNGTSMPTLLHSHGVRMDNAFDGSPTTQKEIRPGETFAYKLSFPDAGMYWYHPHVREDYQQELGLYGNYLVVPEDAAYWSPVNREVALVLDDLLIENGRINLSKTVVDHTLMGRFGNVMLVNGETDYALDARRGETVRFYLTNTANARPFNVAIRGARMKLVGADGGAYERDRWVDAVTLGPSERAVVEVLFETAGDYALEHRTPGRTYALGTVRVSDEPADPSYAARFAELASHPAAVASIDPLRPYFSAAPDKRLALAVDMAGMGGAGHAGHMMPSGATEDGIEWEDAGMAMMNAMSNTSNVRWNLVDEDTGMQNMDIDWSFARGTPVKIRIENKIDSAHPMQHPIHFHGQRFLVVSRDGVLQTNLAWKDTVLVRTGETVDLILDTANPGMWMAHCHVAEHLEAGMMFEFEVR